MKIILSIVNANGIHNGKYIGLNDEFVETESAARIFDSILAADAHSAYLEHVLGVQCFACLAGTHKGERK